MEKLLFVVWLVVNAGGAEMGKGEAAVWAQEENYFEGWGCDEVSGALG